MTAQDVLEEKQQREQMLMVAGMAAVVAAVAMVIPALLGLLVFLGLRDRLRRKEWFVVLGASSVGVLLTFGVTVPGYLGWVGRLIVHQEFGGVPWLSLVGLTGVFAGVIGSLYGTAVGDQVLVKLKLRPEPDDDLMPSEAELKRLEKIRPTAQQMVVDQQTHSLMVGGEPGKRSFPIGIDRNGSTAMLNEDEVKTHVFVLGATGSGKTETLKNLAGNLLDLGWQLVTIDLKEDTAPGGLRDFLRDYAHSHAQYFQQLALSDPQNRFWFNPLYGMSPDEAVNALMALQEFDDGYWQAINKTMLGQIVTLFYDAHRADPATYAAPDMYTIGQTLRAPDLKAATRKMVELVVSTIPGRELANFSSLVKPDEAERKSAGGLGARIINMYESEAGRLVLRSGDGREVMDVTAPGVCYIGLNTLGLSELASVVSTSALLRLATLAGARTTGQTEKGSSRIAVLIDEANWIDRKNVQNLLSRARSAGITVILATQGANDWNDKDGQDWEKIVNNVNVGIIMRQGGPESAEMCAEYIGKRKKVSLTNQILEGQQTGAASMREIEEYWVSPDQLRELRIGQAMVCVGVPQQRREWVRVNLREPGIHVGGYQAPTPTSPQAAPRRERPRPAAPFSTPGPEPAPLAEQVLAGDNPAAEGSPAPGAAPSPPAPGGSAPAPAPKADDDGWTSL